MTAGVCDPARERKALTLRSALFSLLGIFLMSALPGFHDNVCRSGTTMIGNHLPGGALAYLFFVGFAWNGLAGRISRRLALSPKEMAVVLVATLAACFPPTAGLYRYFFRIVMLPWYYLPGHPEWAQHGLLEGLRPDLFPAPYIGAGVPTPGTPEYSAYQEVYQGFFSGLATGSHWVPLPELPLRAWIRPMLAWGPLVLVVSLACISLQFLVHRQWAQHEQLSYPLAQVTSRFCWREDGRPGVPDLFRNRLFWYGFAPVFALYMLEFLGAKYPTVFPSARQILPNLRGWWLPVRNTYPALTHAPSTWSLNGQSLFFTIVGAAYFVSTEISLTVGLSSIALGVVGVLYYRLTGSQIAGVDMELSRAGGYVGYTLILLYTGRAYFRSVFARAFGLRRGGMSGDDGAAVLAARVLVASFAGFVLVLCAMGMEAAVAVAFALVVLMLFFVFTRIICETGIPYLQPGWAPPRMLVLLLGPGVVGAKALALLYWVNVVLTQDPRECLMPYVATGAKVADDTGLRLSRVFWIAAGAVAVALCVAFFASFYTHYNAGAMTDGWSSNGAVVIPFNECARIMREMKDVGEFEPASAGTALGRLWLARPASGAVPFFAAGALLVVACSLMRFKFSKFPIHPVLFMVWGTTPAERCWWSFVVGWFCKAVVVRFGGGGVYQRLKPLFVGVISGELLFIGFQIAYGLVYLWITGTAPTFGVRALPT